MSINTRLDDLSNAINARFPLPQPPAPHWDFSHLSDDEVVSFEALLRRLGVDDGGNCNLANATEYELVELATIQSRLTPEK